jgi:hypothetical protein
MARSRKEDTHLAGDGSEGVGCGALADSAHEDPRCAEHFSIRTTTSAFNLNATFGLAFDIGKSLTIGARYRSPLWLNDRSAQMAGDAVVCLDDAAADAELYDTGLPSCSSASSVDAEARVHVPQEAAIGWSAVLGAKQEWQFDGNLYWVDRCPGWDAGWGSQCGGDDAIRTSLTGLDQNAAVLPEFKIYRGLQDLFGLELWGRRRVLGSAPGPRAEESADSSKIRELSLLFGAGFRSPGVRRGAVTVVESELWTLSANLGARLNLARGEAKRRRRGGWYLAPGYGLDVVLPATVGGSGGRTSDFDSQAALDFAASGRDINGPGADAVLAGRARPTNAGRYFQDVHVFSLGIGWSELPF